MSFSSRRRNYLLTPHRRDGLIEWMKSMLMHSFVLDALDTTGADTFSHFEMLIEEHRKMDGSEDRPSRLKTLVPTVGTFHTHLPLRRAFLAYNAKHCITKRRHVCISFNELRHILNLAQIMAMRRGDQELDPDTDRNLNDFALSTSLHVSQLSEGMPSRTTSDAVEDGPFNGPRLITFDGDQTLYSDGANFESNPKLANYLYLLLKHGVTIAVVTAAGYEYVTEKYELRLSGLLQYFQDMGLSAEDCERFYLFGGECNYLLQLEDDYKLHPVKEEGPGGWITSTRYLAEAPGNWTEEEVTELLEVAQESITQTVQDHHLKARVITKRRAIGLVPMQGEVLPREALDEAVLRVTEECRKINPSIPYCAFNGGRDVWTDVGNKRVGVQILQSYLGISQTETLHIGDQFLNTGNDFAARDVCPCVWITSPEETTYILKSILRLAGKGEIPESPALVARKAPDSVPPVNFEEIDRRTCAVNATQYMDVYTGEMTMSASTQSLSKQQQQQHGG